MIPSLLKKNPSPREDYMSGTWDYARGRAATDHPEYRTAVEMAAHPAAYELHSPPFDSGWIRTWQDVCAVLKGCWFSEERSMRPINFTRFLRHYKGKWAGQRFEFADFWRWDIIMPLFGWMRRLDSPDEKPLRRYRRGSVWVSKKNMKTTSFSATLSYLLGFDGEEGAEVYSAAIDKEQAGRVYKDCETMMRKAQPIVRNEFKFTNSKHQIAHPETNSIYRPLSSLGDNSEGLDISALFYDEIHALKTDKLWKVLRYGDIARAQPLFMAFSTSGEYDPEAVGYQEFEYAVKVRDGIVENDEYFSYVAALDPDVDDWEDPECWKKANPAWGITANLEEMTRKYQDAKDKPNEIVDFKRYRLGIWVNSVNCFINMDAWNKRCGESPVSVDDGVFFWGGLDLSSKCDITAYINVFEPDESGVIPVRSRFYVPEAMVLELEHRDEVPYRQWVSDGFVTATPGERVDYSFIIRDVMEDYGGGHLVDIGFDPWNAEGVRQELDDFNGVPCFEIRQGYGHLSEPLKELQALINEGKIQHGGNPVLRWMASNLVADMDPNGNVKPNKSKSINKIDGMVALIMALARMSASEPPSNTGIIVL